MKLSHSTIVSYKGDVIPLKLISDTEKRAENVIWTVTGDSAGIRSFENDPELPFSDAVIVSLKKAGESTVTAEHNGQKYTCKVSVRERLHSTSEDKHNYYRGDLHTHTTKTHNHAEFISRTEGFQCDMVNFIKEENLLDFGVMSDHSIVMGYGYEFMQGFLTEESARPMGPILFPGSETGITVIEDNRFGTQTNLGGEIVAINADNHVNAFSWDEFISAFDTSVDPILIFAHPQIDSVKYGPWNFNYEKICKRPRLLEMIKLMEMGNGTPTKANLLHEYSFTRALDAGFKITTSCGSDGHSIRGFKICPGKTVIMAPEKSREAFVDALLSLRAYACESGNVKVRYSVNGMTAPCDLPLTNTYDFHLELDYFEEDESTKIVKCQVVTDRGEWIKEIDSIADSTLDFTVKSGTARYFFLRLQDSEGRRTWTPPVWCSRPFDVQKEKSLTLIDSSKFSVLDEASPENDASKILFGDRIIPYDSDNKHAVAVIDMKDELEISALGYTTPRMPRSIPVVHTECVINHARYPRRIRISTSTDGKKYNPVFSGCINKYSDEEIFEFSPQKARYIKFEVLKTVADEYGREEFLKTGVLIGTLSLYSKNAD